MKLHWSPRSPFVRKVMIFAHEAGLADRIDLVRTVVALDRPHRELMRENPLGKIPTLTTGDGKVLFDSIVICEYLDSLHGGPRLFPQEPESRWRALRWHALGNGMLDTLILWRFERMRPEPQRSRELLDAFELKVRAALDALEKEAAALAQAPFGIGHIGVGTALGYIDFRFSDLAWRDGRPRLAEWYAAFAQRPSVQRTLPADE
jgi:glutathione S-transferase